MSATSFVRHYALSCYTFDEEEDYLIGRLIHKHMHGKRVLDLGCGPVAPLTSVFYPQAKEVIAIDRLKANLDFARYNAHELDKIKQRAIAYKHHYLSKKDVHPRIRLIQGDVTEKLSVGKFDSVMQIGCFGALDTKEQFQKAVSHAYHYLKKGSTLLMVNWLDERKKVKRPFHFNGKVNSLQLYKPCMKKAGFTIKEFHTTSRISNETKRLGYTRIVWAVAKK